MLDVGYSGNHSVGLWVTADLNQARPNLVGQALPVMARHPDTIFDYIDSNFNAGFSTYNGLQVKLEKRPPPCRPDSRKPPSRRCGIR